MGFDVLVGFVLTPVIISHLGRSGYGIWTLVGSFLGYYGLLNIGVGSAMTRYVARYASQNDQDALNRTVSTAMTMFCCTGTLVIVLSILLAGPLAHFFEVAPGQAGDFRRVVVILGFATAIAFPGNVFATILNAHERFVATNCVHTGVGALRAGLTVLLLRQGFGLHGVAFAALASQIADLAVNFLLLRRCVPSLRIHPSLASTGMLRTLVTYGSVTTVITVADIMRVNLDSVVIGKWVGLSAVGVYGVAAMIKKHVFRVVARGMTVLGPRFAALDGAGEHEKARVLLQKALAIASFLSFGGCLMVLAFGGHFIHLWVGEGFAESVVVLRILAVCTAVAVAQNPSIVFLYSLNKHYWYAGVTMVEAIVNVVLSIVLVFKYGIVGVALGTMIPMLIVKTLVMPFYVSHVAGLSPRAYVRPLAPSMALAAVLLTAAYELGMVTGPTPSIWALLIYGVVTGGLYAAAGYFLIVRRYGRIL